MDLLYQGNVFYDAEVGEQGCLECDGDRMDIVKDVK